MEVGARDAYIDAAEAVVGAEGEDEDIDGLAEDPVDAAGAAGGRFAAQAGVDDAPAEAGGGEFLLDEGGVGLAGGVVEAVAGGEAVAEKQDGFQRGFGGGQGAEHENKKDVTESLHRLPKSGGGFSCAHCA